MLALRTLRWQTLLPRRRPSYERLGSDYGGYCVRLEGLGRNSIVYSFGVGTDISFDEAIFARVGCRVEAFDPTPRSANWVRSQSLPDWFHFHEIGIADYDGGATFFPPADPSHVSFASDPSSTHSREGVQAEVRRLSTLMASIGDDHIDVLKMDIEGQEFAVIANLARSGPSVGQILVEFHHRFYQDGWARLARTVRQLRGSGYRPFYVSANWLMASFVR